MAVGLGEILKLPALRRAEIRAGRDRVAGKDVSWASAIEWHGASFVRSGELVLTTALGCDAVRLEQFIVRLAEQGASAVVIALRPGGDLETLPEQVAGVCAARGLVLLELPWEVRFAHVTMAIVDAILARRYEPMLAEGGELATALIEDRGADAIAEAAERALGRSVIVLDAAFVPIGRGPLATQTFHQALAAWPDADALRSVPDAPLGPQAFTPPPHLGMPGGLLATARARKRTLGYVFALADEPGGGIGPLESRVLDQAATALAITQLRARAIADSESRIRGGLLWELASRSGTPDGMRVTAAALGYDLAARHHVAVGVAPTADEAEEIGRSLRRGAAARELKVGVLDTQVLVLADEDRRPALISALRAIPSAAWGVSADAVALERIDVGHAAARRALDVGATLGDGPVHDGAALAPYLVLADLGDGSDVVSACAAVLEELLAYDGDTRRGLLRTLEVYLEHQGNVSATARDLYLNRHSLIYRLDKIEALTGRRLRVPQDRFLLELSVNIHRLARAGRRTPEDRPGA